MLKKTVSFELLSGVFFILPFFLDVEIITKLKYNIEEFLNNFSYAQ